MTIKIKCQHCAELVDKTDYNGDTSECNECHDQVDFDECGCMRCYDRLAGAADALYDRMRDGE